ncbi:MAG: hypothetical protein ACI3V2_07640 [Faecousia sp.]
MKNKVFSLLLVLAVLVSCFGTAFVPEAKAAAVDTDEIIVADWLNASTVVTRGADTLMSEYADAGITDVYLLVKGTAGKLAWQSSVSGVTLLYSSRDVLKETCTAAAKYGIRVHAWMMASRDDAYIARDSDALAYHFRVGYGSDVNQYINLRDSDYQSYITALVKELVANYDIAGIHLDTIRYGALYYDWGANARTELINNYGITTAEYNAATLAMCVSGGYSYYVGDDGYYRYSSSGTAASGVNFATALAGGGSTNAYNGAKKFAQMRIDTVTNFVKVVRNAAGSDKVVSCAIMPETASDSYSKAVYGQDPASLKDTVDYVAIMTYASQYGAASTWPANMAKSAAADGCNAVAAIQTFDCENTNADPTCQDIYDEYTNVLATRATVNASSAYSGKILGYAFFRAAKTCLAGAEVVNSNTINFSVHNQDEAETSLTKLVFTMKNGVTIQSISNKSGWGSSTFTISSDKTTLTISNSSSALGAYGSGTFTMTYSGTVDASKGACMLTVYKSSNVEDYAYCGTIMPTHTHAYTSSVTTAATCTTDGVMTYTCACGDNYTEAIPATGHSYTGTVTKEATCGAEGVRTYTCSQCGDTYTEAIAKTGNHSYSSSYDSATGITTYTCSVCGNSYTSGCGIVHTNVETWSTGEKTHLAYCYNCHVGEEYYCHFVESSRVDATCTTAGSVTYVCGGHYDLSTGELVQDAFSGAGCTNTYTETLPAGHKYTYAGNQDGTHTGTCSGCGATTISACAYIDGVCCVCGDRELLYFDFTNDENAQARYDSEVYGNYNFDTGCWKSNVSRNEAPTYDNEAGTMTTKVVGESPYLQTNDGSNSLATYPLSFNPSEVELIEIRLKLNGLTKITEGSTGVNLRIYKQTAVVGQESDDAVMLSIPFEEANLTSNEFFTLTVPARGLLDDVEYIPAIRLTIHNAMADGSGDSAITFDYIYMGPNYTDKSTVYFLSEDGTVTYDYEIATPGSTVTYQGETLTKASTESYHYNFVGWKTADGTLMDLTTATFTEDTNLYAAFAEVAHRYVLNNSVEPTCRTSGYSSYTCRDCGYDHTILLSALDYHNYGANGICIWCGDGSGSALLHFKEESDELNWSWQFTNGTDTTVSFRDPDKNGVMFAETDATTINPYFEFTGTAENIHTIQSGDIVEIRYKISNTAATGTTPIFRIRTGGSSTYDGRFVSESLVPTKSWQVIQIPIDSEEILGKTIEGFAFTPAQGNGAMKCEIDYIYIGQPEVAPVMLSYYKADGSPSWEIPVAYGTLGAWYGDTPEKEDHIFIGWTDSTGTMIEPTAVVFTEDSEFFPAYRCSPENVAHYDAVAALCTEAGNAEYWYCSVCDKYFIDEDCSMETTREALTIEAAGHDWVEATEDENYVAPTCTETGFAPMVCSVCGAAGESKELSSLGHDMVAGTVHPATCTVDGYTDYACSRCGATDIGDIVPAEGHQFLYTDNGDGTHTVGCENCDYSAVEDHTFVDGTCDCGAKEVTGSTEDSELKFVTTAFTMGAELKFVFIMTSATATKYPTTYVDVVVNGADGETTVRYNLEDMVQYGAVYRVEFAGIAAKNMGDSFTATIHAEAADGTQYVGVPKTASIAEQIKATLRKSNATAAAKTLAVDLLNYGAAAQQYFGYDTAHLVNGDLTAEELAYGTQEVPTIANTMSKTGTGTITVVTPSVTLRSKVTLNMLFNTANYTGDVSKLTYKVTDAATGEVVFTGTPVQQSGTIYKCVYDDVGAKRMRSEVTIGIYDENDVLVSQVQTWSVESYIADILGRSSTSDTIRALLENMIKYGDAVAKYLG